MTYGKRAQIVAWDVLQSKDKFSRPKGQQQISQVLKGASRTNTSSEKITVIILALVHPVHSEPRALPCLVVDSDKSTFNS